MTILPKKKVTKDKNESDNVDKGLSHHPRHHPSGTENRHEKPARVRNSPTRWLPTPGREDAAHVDPGPYDAHDSAAGHNKRRHRSSPHRNHPRKHRGAHSGHASIAPAVAAHSPQQGVSYEEEEPTRNSDDEYVPPQHPENIEELEKWFETSLKEKRGFSIRKMGEDGACLFRAVADQVYGDQEMHGTVRKQCIEYLAKNSDYYSHYVTEDFNTYLNRKRMENCHGNHLEIQAMCEIYNRPIEVYQYSIDPINTFHGSYKTDNEPVRISYHRNVHYNAVIDPYKQTVGVGLGLPLSNFQPGLSEPTLVRDATRQSEELHLEQAMLEDKIRETDWEVTQETLQEQVARESYLSWLRDNEKRMRSSQNCTASATCSSSSEYSQLLDGPSAPDVRHARSPHHKTSNPGSPKTLDMSPRQHESKGSPMSDVAAVGEGAVGGREYETHSIVGQYPESIYADYANFGEEDILAQVIAQSQQEYIDSFKRGAHPPLPGADKGSPRAPGRPDSPPS
ncbi:OTU domain-containing protein 5-A-like [Mya arenaria]|uniref:OTU domain-containing protein 5-A-like n=1 Tax=Mya arenaria TaxID=6604 RepID=UPI0022E96C0E|nr:OTU domain-containing protein 5-A-like [Mya arenaria]